MKSLYIPSIVVISLVVFGLHYYHVSVLHENTYFFSHLSTFEREMSFRSERGFYYYFYKLLVQAPSFSQGWYSLVKNNATEYPDTINAVEKFNIYPEIFVAILFRLYRQLCDIFNIMNQVCYEIHRGEQLSPVVSCVGSGVSEIFYTNFVWVMAGFTTTFLFLYAVYLSESIIGGCLTVLCYFYNHSEATRVMFTPQLRECFTYPLLVLQFLYLSYIVQTVYKPKKSVSFMRDILFFSQLCNLCLISWQFSQFIFLTQCCAVLVLYFIYSKFYKNLLIIVISFLISIFQAYCLMFCNEFLLSSIFTCVLISSLVTIPALHSTYRGFITYWLRGCCVLFIIVQAWCLKYYVLTWTHDGHIFSILKAKFSSFSDFHTQLYLCSKEFDFLSWIDFFKLVFSFLVPAVILTVVLLFLQWIKTVRSNRLHGKLEAKIVFNLLQLASFTLLGFLFMRLKLFLTSHLCVMVSLLTSKYGAYLIGSRIRWIGVTLLILIMSKVGVQNLKDQHNLADTYDYEDIHLENLLKVIAQNIPHNSSFGGMMQFTSSILLVTGRPVVNHPHYEYTQMRTRTEQIYSAYSRKPLAEVHSILTNQNVDYFLSSTTCFQGMSPGCSYSDIWDSIDNKNRHRPTTCHLMKQENKWFLPIYRNHMFILYKLKK